MANEKIEVGYKRLRDYSHKYIVYTDTNGNQHIAHGGSTSWPIWGDIGAYHGRAGSSEELTVCRRMG